jgi:hypothetical protein
MIKPGTRFVVGGAALIAVFLPVASARSQPSSTVARHQGADCCARPRENGSGPQAARGSKATRSQTDPSRVSFFTVPLVCSAAPKIGCGSRSKPVLEALERNPSVAAAWLNRAGTVIAVEWAENASPTQRAAALEATSKTSNLSMAELSGDKRKAVLRDFAPERWYRPSEVDHLSEEEADIIGARLARRVAATVTRSDHQSDELGRALGAAIKRCWLSSCSDPVEEAVLSAGREYLNEKGLAALKHAFSLGYQPLPGEK